MRRLLQKLRPGGGEPPGSLRSEVRAELRFHIEEEVDRLVRQGCDPVQARQEVMQQFHAGVESECIRISARRMRRQRWEAAVQSLVQDFWLVIRSFSRRPGLPLVSVLTFALGAGAVTTIFSVADGVLWRPLPYQSPEQLVRLAGTWPRGGQATLAPPMFFDWQRQSRSFSALAAVVTENMDLQTEGQPQRFKGGAVSAEFLPLLGIAPGRGRWFEESEDEPSANKTVVLSHRVWRSHWEADPAIIGRALTLNGNPYTVIGVMPADFHPPQGLNLERVDVWFPLAFFNADLDSHNISFLRVIGRLKDGVSLESARQEMDSLSERLVQGYPARSYPDPFGYQAEPLQRSGVGRVEPTLLMLLGAVGLLLLIASLNVAGLQLVRSDSRREELALRGALGASRSRIVRHLLSESLVLALTGGAAGVLIAVLGVRAFAAFGPGDLPRMAEISVNFRVLGFAIAVSALAGILFGFLPALRTTRISLLANLGKGAAGSSASGPGRSRLQSAFVVVQTGMALVLLTGAGLLLNSLARLVQVDPGFDPGNVTVMHLSLGTGYQTKEQRTAFFTQLLDNLRALPGVESAGLCNGLPFGVSGTGGRVVFEEADVSSGSSRWQLVSDGFLSTIGVDVLAGGRSLSPQDILAGAPVVLVNKAFADKYWPGQEAVGKRIKIISTGKDAPWLEVAGITPSFKQNRLGQPGQPEAFVPYTQPHFIFPFMDFAVRSSLEPQGLARSLRNAVWSVDPNQPVDWISSLQQRISLSLSQPRFYAILLSLFAALALILAAVGIYGTLSFWVSQRTCELSIRMALGASGRRLAVGVLRQGLALVLAGTAIGLAASSLASRTLSNFLYGVSPTDWMTFTAVSLFLVLTATAAISLPARRAMQVDPIKNLRT